MSAIAKSAKARGQTGFLHPLRTYAVRVILGENRLLAHSGAVKKEAWQAARRWLRNSQDQHGAWFGAQVDLTIDGVLVPAEVVAKHYHAPHL